MRFFILTFFILSSVYFSILFAQGSTSFGKCVSGNCKNGSGTWVFNHLKYVGQFRNGDFHGRGIITACVGSRCDKYEGQWLNGKKNGNGTEITYGGSKYVGEWQNGIKHGRGVQTDTDGSIQDGIWENNEFIGSHVNKENYDKITAGWSEKQVKELLGEPGSIVDGPNSGDRAWLYSTGDAAEGFQIIFNSKRVVIEKYWNTPGGDK